MRVLVRPRGHRVLRRRDDPARRRHAASGHARRPHRRHPHRRRLCAGSWSTGERARGETESRCISASRPSRCGRNAVKTRGWQGRTVRPGAVGHRPGCWRGRLGWRQRGPPLRPRQEAKSLAPLIAFPIRSRQTRPIGKSSRLADPNQVQSRIAAPSDSRPRNACGPCFQNARANFDLMEPLAVPSNRNCAHRSWLCSRHISAG